MIDLLHSYFKITGDDDERTRREKVTGDVLDARSLAGRHAAVPVRAARNHRGAEHIGIGSRPRSSRRYLHELQKKTRSRRWIAGRKRRTLDAIKRILLRESLNQPLMVIFEDLHWIDEETQALSEPARRLDRHCEDPAAGQLPSRVLASVGLARPTTRSLRLDPLGKEIAEEMLAALLGDGVELAPLKRLIIEKTEGNPFFMEETVQVLFDESALVRDGDDGQAHQGAERAEDSADRSGDSRRAHRPPAAGCQRPVTDAGGNWPRISAVADSRGGLDPG